jgi:transcriptional regulator with XRE-family HTH domain
VVSVGTNGPFWNFRLFEVEPNVARAGLGKRVRSVRQQRLGLTLAEFGRQIAELSGRRRSFSNVTVANWESGRQEPNFATLQAISRLANLPLCYFAGVGELSEYPRINWFAEMSHESDGRLRRLFSELHDMPTPQRRQAIGAIGGLLEGLHRADLEAEEESDED